MLIWFRWSLVPVSLQFISCKPLFMASNFALTSDLTSSSSLAAAPFLSVGPVSKLRSKKTGVRTKNKEIFFFFTHLLFKKINSLSVTLILKMMSLLAAANKRCLDTATHQSVINAFK